MAYTEKTFDLPNLEGISEEQVKAHLGLYAGYVKHVNLIAEKLGAVRDGSLELDPYIVAELRRRFAFEFDGMRMHEYYFTQFEGGPKEMDGGSKLAELSKKYGEQGLVGHIKEVAGSRGIGWVVVYQDGTELHTTFVTDHELGQLAGLNIVLALDVWEHAFMVDYLPSEKGKYLDAFFANLNWSTVESRVQ